jgi:hypothetical protein
VRVGAVVRSVTAIRLSLVLGVHGSVRVDDAAVAVVLLAGGAVWAILLEARAGLGANADACALLNVLYVAADLDGFADDLVADDAG